jgi:S1-C subfamily serine protease
MITELSVSGEAVPPSPPERPKRQWNTAELRRRVFVGVLAVWAVAITALVVRGGGDDSPAPAAVAPKPSPSTSEGPLSVADIYKTLLPSVVQIKSTGGSTVSGQKGGATQVATGSGVIVNADGTILTALHVVDGAKAIEISYTDGSKSAATVANSNAAQDTATLTPAKLPETVVPAVLGGGLQVGDPVVAIGNPLGLTATTTSGVVSGLDRTMAREKAPAISGLIQFDAAVNPGSSGGPLLNDQGQVAGIVVALANPTDAGTFIGIGFAVPIGAALGGGGQGNGQAPPL